LNCQTAGKRRLASSDEYEIGDRSFSSLRLRLGEQSQARAASRKKREQKLGKSSPQEEEKRK
jgi:hypothetical protein